MSHRLIPALSTLALLAPLSLAPSFAADTGGSTVPECKQGEVYDKETQKCVKQNSGVDDDSLYTTGRQLALAGRYDEAITVLSLVADKNDPKTLTYLGYAHRKRGDIDAGIGYYEAAVEIDPNYTQVREYLGEAHLQRGDLASAKMQLAAIERLCGTSCDDYTHLSAEISAFKG